MEESKRKYLRQNYKIMSRFLRKITDDEHTNFHINQHSGNYPEDILLRQLLNKTKEQELPKTKK